MENNYYLKPKFASARIGAEVTNYVIIIYKGTHEMNSYGLRIKHDPEKVFDLRRGKIVNKYYRFNASGDTCSIYDAELCSFGREIFFSSPETPRVYVDYQELSNLYNPTWYQEKIAAIKVSRINPLQQNEFYARFYNVPLRMLKLGALFYQKPELSCGYLINDGSNRYAIDIMKKKLIILSKEKCTFYQATQPTLQKSSKSGYLAIETKKRDFDFGGGDNKNPILLEIKEKDLQEAYSRLWHDPKQPAIGADWAPIGEW